jgi:CRP/FNR family transcriptional regulator, cyclic AMP receptor protein
MRNEASSRRVTAERDTNRDDGNRTEAERRIQCRRVSWLRETESVSRPVSTRRGHFTQGDSGRSIGYIHTGRLKFSVHSKTGREAIVGMLGPGDFFGEGCLAGQSIRMGSVTAITASTILLVDQECMAHMLRRQHALSDRFLGHLLARNIQIEAALLAISFATPRSNDWRGCSCDSRTRASRAWPARTIPRISQDTLASMVGSSRPQVAILMQEFRRQGFIDDTDSILESRGGRLT